MHIYVVYQELTLCFVHNISLNFVHVDMWKEGVLSSCPNVKCYCDLLLFTIVMHDLLLLCM